MAGRLPSPRVLAFLVTLIAVIGVPLRLLPSSTTLAMPGLAFAAATISSRMPPAPAYRLKTPSAWSDRRAAVFWARRVTPWPARESASAEARITSTVTLPPARLTIRISSRSTPAATSLASWSAVSSPL